jgi:hypothetical protein
MRLTKELKRTRGHESDEDEEEEEIDQLVDNDELADEDDEEIEGEGRYGEGKRAGEVWDPFGDEAEL